jgi:hypothetical protein
VADIYVLALPFPSGLQIQKSLDLDMNGESDRNGPASKFCLSLQEVYLFYTDEELRKVFPRVALNCQVGYG